MSRLICSFCSHGNPEGSKFCNECGSPLHLVPCTQCEAINNESDARCSRCGAPLSAVAIEQVAEGSALAAEIAQAEPGGAISSVPIALADHLDEFPWDPRVKAERAHAAVEERALSSADAHAVAEAVAVVDADAVAEAEAVPESNSLADGRPDEAAPEPYRRSRVDYDEGRRPRARAVLLAAALLGVAAVVYWPDADHMRPADAPETSAAPASTAIEPARGPEAQAPAAGMPTESREAASSAQPVADPAQPVADTSPSSANPPEGAVTEPPTASADTASRAAVSPPESADVPAPASRQTVKAVALKGGADKGHGVGDARRRTSAHARTKEQAERDALATQRLIARDLGVAPRASPDSPTAPAP